MPFDPNHVLTQADLNYMNAAARATGSDEANNKSLGRIMERATADVARYFLDTENGRNLVPKTLIGLKIRDILDTNDYRMNVRLQIGMLLASGYERQSVGSDPEVRQEIKAFGSVTDAAREALANRMGDGKRAFIRMLQSGVQVTFQDGQWVLTTEWHRLGRGQYFDGMTTIDFDAQNDPDQTGQISEDDEDNE